MTFGQSVSTVLSKYATFSGRATRPEFWWWILFLFVVMSVSQIIDATLLGPVLGFSIGDGDAGQPLTMFVSLALLLPNIAVAVRRLHDIGRSGWWILIAFVPIVGFFVLLYWDVQPSADGQNQYG